MKLTERRNPFLPIQYNDLILGQVRIGPAFTPHPSFCGGLLLFSWPDRGDDHAERVHDYFRLNYSRYSLFTVLSEYQGHYISRLVELGWHKSPGWKNPNSHAMVHLLSNKRLGATRADSVKRKSKRTRSNRVSKGNIGPTRRRRVSQGLRPHHSLHGARP